MENFDKLGPQVVYSDKITDLSTSSFTKSIDDTNNIRISKLGKLLYLKPGDLVETIDEPINLVSIYLSDGSLFNKFSIEGTIIEYFWFTNHIELVVFFLLDSTLLIYSPSGHKIKAFNIENLFLERYPRINSPNFEDIRPIQDKIILLYDTNSFLQLTELVNKDELKQLYDKSQRTAKLTNIVPDLNIIKPNTNVLSYDVIELKDNILVYSLNKTSSSLSVLKYDFNNNSVTPFSLAHNFTDNTNYIKLIEVSKKLFVLLFNNKGDIVIFDDNISKEIMTIKIDLNRPIKSLSIVYYEQTNILIKADENLVLLKLQLDTNKFIFKKLELFNQYNSQQIFTCNNTKLYIYSDNVIYSITLFGQLFHKLTEKVYKNLSIATLHDMKVNFQNKYSDNTIKNFFLFSNINEDKKYSLKTLLFIYNFGFNLLSLKNEKEQRINILYNLKFVSNYIKTKHESSLNQLYKLTNNKNTDLLFTKEYLRIVRTVIEFDKLQYTFTFRDLLSEDGNNYENQDTLKVIVNESLYYKNLKTFFSLILLYYKENTKLFYEHFALFLEYKLKHSLFKKNEFLVMFLIQVFGYKWEPSVILLIVNLLKDSYNLLSKREFMNDVLKSDYVKLPVENNDNSKMIELCKMFINEGMVKETAQLVVRTNKQVIYEVLEMVNKAFLEEYKGTYYEEYIIECYLNEKYNEIKGSVENEKIRNIIQNKLMMLKNK